MKSKNVLPTCILIFCLLMGFYLFSFNGMGVTDDEQLFVILTSNLTKDLGNSTLPLYGNDRIRGEPANTEPLHPLLGVPFYKLAESFDLGRAQILHLPAGIYTALTAMLLALIALRRGYARKSATFLALIYGLCTIALPYARTNFREPLAALCLTCALFCVENLRSRDLHLRNILINLAAMLIFAGLAALTKIMCALCLPFFLIAAGLNLKQHHGLQRKRLIISLAICLLAGSVTALLFLSSRSDMVNDRFSLAFITDMFATLTRLPHNHFWQALAGMLISPGKGLLIYSPVLILSFVSLIPNRWLSLSESGSHSTNRRLSTPKHGSSFSNRWLSLSKPTTSDQVIAFGSLIALMVLQALLYNDEWWNITWGTRALLPALPLLMLVGLPAVDAGLKHIVMKMRLFTWGLAALSFLIQIGRILTTDPAYLGWLAHVTRKTVIVSQWWDIRLMPLWRHWELAFQGIPGGTAWLHLQGANQVYALLIAGACLLFSLICAYLLLRKKETGLINTVMLLLLILGLMPALLTSVRTDRRYYAEVEEYQQACTWIKENLNTNKLLLVNAYLKPMWFYNFNFNCTQGEWLGLTYEHSKAYELEAYYPRLRDLVLLIEEKRAQGVEVYLVETIPSDPLTYQAELERYGLLFRQTQLFLDSDSNGVIFTILE